MTNSSEPLPFILFRSAALRQINQLKRFGELQSIIPAELNIGDKQLREIARNPIFIDSDQISHDLVEWFIENGLLQRDEPKTSDAKFPFIFVTAINIELTYSCNLACSHCLQAPIRPAGLSQWLDTAIVKQALLEAKCLGLTRTGCNLTGGETFMPHSPILELIAYANNIGTPARANTNAWWGNHQNIKIGDMVFPTDSSLVEYLKEIGLGRLALSLDDRYLQYPELLERVIRVASLCEKQNQPYEFVITEPNPSIHQQAIKLLHESIGGYPQFMVSTPMEMVDVGAAKITPGFSDQNNEIDKLALSSPCAGKGFHRPYYLHIAPDGGVRSCLYAPAGGWLGNISEVNFFNILNAAAANPVFKLFEHDELANFVETYLNPWQNQYRSIGHGCAASALIARLAEKVYAVTEKQGGQPSAMQMSEIHKHLSIEMGLESPSNRQNEKLMVAQGGLKLP